MPPTHSIAAIGLVHSSGKSLPISWFTIAVITGDSHIFLGLNMRGEFTLVVNHSAMPSVIWNGRLVIEKHGGHAGPPCFSSAEKPFDASTLLFYYPLNTGKEVILNISVIITVRWLRPDL